MQEPFEKVFKLLFAKAKDYIVFAKTTNCKSCSITI